MVNMPGKEERGGAIERVLTRTATLTLWVKAGHIGNTQGRTHGAMQIGRGYHRELESNVDLKTRLCA